MAYWAAYYESTGELVSHGSRQPTQLPAGVGLKDVGQRPNLRTHEWNPQLLNFVERSVTPTQDRLDFVRLRDDGIQTDTDLKRAIHLLLLAQRPDLFVEL